ncbi:MAG: hypothetical protein CMD02_00865 [Flavobacteriales bacterium]|nr:hypothetical protein [Flavobacteriales bacterium]|tara:strand:- start:1241 stop:1519 length:279 start_codon:yes stop_codon:yes gene_type:complete
MYYSDKNKKEKISNEFRKEFSLLSDDDLIKRFNTLSTNIRKKRFSYGITMSIYMKKMHDELNNRFDISNIVNDSQISFKNEIMIINKKIIKC